jgi:hypothetical protein
MIKSTFSEVISNPEKLDSLTISDLQGVIHEFPYFSAAQLLLAKKLKIEDSVLFEKQLNLTAAYVPSRKVLYNLIHSAPVVVETASEPIQHEVETIIEEKEEVVQNDELDQLIQAESASNYSLADLPEIEKPVEKTLQFTGNQTLNFTDWLEFFEGNKPESLKSEGEIIEDFIQENPHIGAAKHEDIPVENLAKPSSLDIDDEIVTETLAKIHLDQGNRMKAVEIYERLKLKYPEKSPYFAAQIEFIKQK